MKARYLAVGLVLSALAGSPAVAQTVQGTSSFTLGVARADMNLIDDGSISGLNLKYQFERAGERLGFLGSFSYLSGESTYRRAGAESKFDQRYYSLAFGPSYRVLDQVALYGTFGFAGANAEMGRLSVNDHFEPVFGAGVRIYPYGRLVIDGYVEKGTAFSSGPTHMDTDLVSLGLGWTF